MLHVLEGHEAPTIRPVLLKDAPNATTCNSIVLSIVLAILLCDFHEARSHKAVPKTSLWWFWYWQQR